MLRRSTRKKKANKSSNENNTVPEIAADVHQNKDPEHSSNLLEAEAETSLNDEGEGNASVDNANLNSEVVVVVVEDNVILNLDKILENNSNSISNNEVVVVEEKSLDTVFRALEDIMNLESEGVEGKMNKDDANLEENSNLKSDIQVDAEVDAAAVGAVEEENSAANTTDMKSQGHIDDTLIIREGGDGEGDGEKSREDVEDDEDNEYGEEDCEKSTEDVEDDEDNEYSEEDVEKSTEEVEDDEDSEYSEEDNEEDEDPSEFSNDPLSDQKKQKQLEIYVGGLDKGAVEEDLIEVFGKFGEVQAARIVKHPTTKKSKGFGFIHYATIEQAKNALSELKDGIEVRGKCVKISVSQDNDTLYMSNICRTWTKEQVLYKLKGYGVKHIEELHLPNDPESEGKIKGFAFLEFSNHSDAMAAFQRLRKPDAVFGHARSAKVAFAQTPIHPSAEVLSQVKTVYIKGLTKSWDVEKLKVLCKQYGEIKKVKLSRNFGAKHKDFAFIVFSSRESALACVEGINNAQIGKGEVKIKADIAKPHARGQLPKVTRGGFKVEKDSGRAAGSKMKGHAKPKACAKESERKRKAGRDKSKVTEKKGKAVAAEKSQAPSKSKSPKEGKPKRPQSIVAEGQDVRVPSKVEKTDHKRKNSPSKADGRGKRARDHDRSKRPSKKPRGVRGRRGSASKSKHHFREGPVHGADSVAYRIPYASGYAPYTSSYQGHANSGISGSKRHRVDMEPHAGYLEPAIRKQDRHYAGYLEPALKHKERAYPRYLEPAPGNQGQPHAKFLELSQSQSQPHTRYLEPAPGNQGQRHARYLEHSQSQSQPYTRYLEPAPGDQGRPHARYFEPSQSQSQPHTGYVEPAIGRESLPHAGFLEPAVVRQGYNVYNYRIRSEAGGYNSHGSQGSTYGGGSARPPYVQNYTNYAGYEDNGNVGGYHHRSEAYLTRQRRY